MDDIEVESFIPQEYWKYGKDELLEKVKELDEEYKKSYEEANAKWNTIKYVASLEKKEEGVELKVWLQEIPLNSPIGNLQGTSNIVVIGTNEHYRKNLGKEVVIKRPWAWVLTADWVASDIKEILRMNAYASRYV
jgi:homoserine dehydrogenase